MKAVETKKAPAAIGPYSQAMIAGELVFASGQIPLDPATGVLETGDISAQTERVLKNLSEVLNAAESGLEHVIKTTCFLADMNDFSAFNEIYSKYFPQKPARSCVAVKALPKGALVEVEVVAMRP